MIRGNLSHSPATDVEISSLPPDQTIKAILGFLEMWLHPFRKEYLSTTSSSLEDEISEKLNLFLQKKSKENNLLFQFGGRKGVDFQIYVEPYLMSAKPIFMIEAKRLPPTNYRDYVQGRTGGIERFKREQEGFILDKNHCAMVGYIQQHSFGDWFEVINQWLTELITANDKHDGITWEESDKLVYVESNTEGVAKYTSNHARKTLLRLTVFHYWLDMCGTQETRDIVLINQRADELNAETMEMLAYQVPID
jgi:hypothetical protein